MLAVAEPAVTAALPSPEPLGRVALAVPVVTVVTVLPVRPQAHLPLEIAVTAVPLFGVNGAEVIVRGLDAINGTPVLDIKPYFPQYDSPDGVRMPEWVERLMVDYF